MQEEIIEIVRKLNGFTEKYKCILEVKPYEYIDLKSKQRKYTYRVVVKE